MLSAINLSLGLRIESTTPGLTSGLRAVMLFVDERRLDLSLCFLRGCTGLSDTAMLLLKKLYNFNCILSFSHAFLVSIVLGCTAVPNLNTQGDKLGHNL